ncbi:HpcH/HpaI aldolase/citrate lyase family protein [Aquimarina rubra]|uniref:HpcH/HpaI aldolase/citrate lyase family protein n=1 Tax=Aquimarina rubra TaxID=1920033 RepID=A0ABW5LJ89_9FLAO
MKKEYLLRSLLFVPGHRENLMQSAIRSNSDAVLLDLEDSVQPKENKKLARELVKKYIQEGVFEGKYIFPRVNDRESGELLKDVYELTLEGIEGFMYPKSKSAKDIYFFSKLLETIEYEKGYEIGTFKIIPLIETASAVLKAEEIAGASTRVIGIAFGSEDFVSDLKGIHDKEHQSIFTPRSIIAMAARAKNVIPIDTVHINVHDLEDLETNLVLSKKLGYEGMLSLHPKELDLIHEHYSPSSLEVENAQLTLKYAEEARKDNKGVAVINGKFIGPPIILKAQEVLRKHNMIQRKKDN